MDRIHRREFLTTSGRALAWLGLGSAAGLLEGCRTDGRGSSDATRAMSGGPTRVTILHTNDVHSRIDPFPPGSGRNAGRAGAVARARLIEEIRAEAARAGDPEPLLVDAGDVFQGTPYFNMFAGELDFKVMSVLGYDVMTIGNHDFDAGLDGLVEAARYADFDLVSANYDFSATPLAERVKPYVIRPMGPLRVGVFGLGVVLEGLVPADLRPGVRYSDPVAAAKRWSSHLRASERCDLIVCLSHLGNHGYGGEPGDQDLARKIDEIDLIVGGHSHTFMSAPTRVDHGKRETLVHQVGFAGINLGRVDFIVDQGRVTRAEAKSIPVVAA